MNDRVERLKRLLELARIESKASGYRGGEHARSTRARQVTAWLDELTALERAEAEAYLKRAAKETAA